ncbi:MAG: putative Ig domain-containing protein [Defluviitaleaceae bacterium]|nr:putative Ig domain-containing protein [Defluviitaleaceae bacterium]
MIEWPTPAADISICCEGVLSWLVPVAGDYTFTVVASNMFGDSAPVEFSLTITTPSIIDVDLDDGIVGIPYSHTFTAIGAEPREWSHTSGNLPPGLSFDPVTGTLSGNPWSTRIM